MKRLLFLTLIVVLLVACGGGQTAVSRSGATANEANEPEVMEEVAPGVDVSFDRAAGLPDASPDLTGAVLQWDGDRLQVGEGPVDARADGANGVVVTHEGPEVTVSWGAETKFFQDVTDLRAAEQTQGNSSLRLQQMVAPLAQPNEDALFVSIWGTREANELVADVVVFQERP